MKTWTTKDGDEIRLRDMTTQHILNCINMLQKAIDEGKAFRVNSSLDWDGTVLEGDVEDITPEYKSMIASFRKELSRRDKLKNIKKGK